MSGGRNTRRAKESEDLPVYLVAPAKNDDDSVIAQAIDILRGRLSAPTATLTRPEDVKAACALTLGTLDREEFWVMYLNARNGLICFEREFVGTLTQTSVYPREIVRSALRHNAAAVILSHNHPSGLPEPSRADELLTQTLKLALALVDVRVLDHIVVGSASTVSFAEKGLL